MKTVTLKLSKYEYELLLRQLSMNVCLASCYHEGVTGHKVSKKIECHDCKKNIALNNIRAQVVGEEICQKKKR